MGYKIKTEYMNDIFVSQNIGHLAEMCLDFQSAYVMTKPLTVLGGIPVYIGELYVINNLISGICHTFRKTIQMRAFHRSRTYCKS